MGTAHSHKARSEPEDGASPEAGAVGYPPGAADRTRDYAAVGSVGRARYSAREWAYPLDTSIWVVPRSAFVPWGWKAHNF